MACLLVSESVLRQTKQYGGLLCMALFAFAGGCTTLFSGYNSKAIANYLVKHPDRPQPIQQALQAGRLEKGMTEKEVRMCWGRPRHVEVQGTGAEQEKEWTYTKKSSYEGSNLWDDEVPVADALFVRTGDAFVLSRWERYGDKVSSDGSTRTATEPSNWPSLSLTGVVTRDKQQYALINEQLVRSGQAIEGVNVLSITPTEIRIEFNGISRVLKVGQSTR